MNEATYRCRNRRCDIKELPGWMLGANPRCPNCSRWMTKLPSHTNDHKTKR